MNAITNFFRQTYTEMKHVIWPSRKHALLYAAIVILFSLALGYLLGAFDLLFKFLMGNLLY